jgi:altronate hydrolase
MGYRRADGRAGTRNFIGVIASVNCSTTVCRTIAEHANRTLLPQFPGVDGFVPIVHGQGCGMSDSGEGMRVLHRTLAGYARHPNFGGILMVGLGCEVNQLSLYGQKGIAAGKRHFNIQEAGGSRKSVEKALGMLSEIAEEVGSLQREPIPVSEIVVGLQCGGSDGMSGITANQRSAPQSISSPAPVASASCPKRRRSTAPNICSPIAQLARRLQRGSMAM